MATDLCSEKGLSEQAKIAPADIQAPRGDSGEGQRPTPVTGSIKSDRGTFKVK